MPIYEYECAECGSVQDKFNAVNDRHCAPLCDCGVMTKLTISACMGVVKFPAAGGHEYISPASGKPITTQRARRDDLARTGSRPYEGFEQEKKEADRWQKDKEKKSDAKLDDATRKAYHQLSPKQRRTLDAA